MGRPLKKSYLQDLNLSVVDKNGTSYVLNRQVGFNKYIVVVTETAEKIVRLVDKASAALEDGEVLLVLKDGDNYYNVLKVTKNLFITSNGIYSYTLVVVDETAVIKFEKSGVSIAQPNDEEEEEVVAATPRRTSRTKTPVVEEVVEETPAEETVEETPAEETVEE